MIIKKALMYLFLLPEFLIYVVSDYIKYIKNKEYQHFNDFGIHIFTGKFGACKTSSQTRYAYNLCKKYKKLQVLTNYKLLNFPPWTVIKPLNNVSDIINSPPETLILIDEIGTIFNSRDFTKGKRGEESVPKILFQHLCQNRKCKKMFLGTSQRYGLVDKQIRDVATTVRACVGHFKNPFTRITRVNTYEAEDYELILCNATAPIKPIGCDVFIQTNQIRHMYDTSQLVNNILTMEYKSDEEINASRAAVADVGIPLDRKSRRMVNKQLKR